MQGLRNIKRSINLKKYFLLSFFLIVIDLYSKYYINNIIQKSYLFFEGFFGLEVAYNTGIAWGLLSGHAEYTLILSLGVLIWLVNEIYQNHDGTNLFPLFLILSGALGNIIERAYGLIIGNAGRVTDFIVLGPIPNFNIADSLISTGIVYLLFVELRSQK